MISFIFEILWRCLPFIIAVSCCLIVPCVMYIYEVVLGKLQFKRFVEEYDDPMDEVIFHFSADDCWNDDAPYEEYLIEIPKPRIRHHPLTDFFKKP